MFALSTRATDGSPAKTYHAVLHSVVLVYYFNYKFWETDLHLSPFVQKVPENEFGHETFINKKTAATPTFYK